MSKRAVLAAGLLIAGGAAAAEIPLKNAGFEEPMPGKRIPGWSRTQHAGIGAYVVSTDSENFAQGKHSISMRRTVEQEYGLIMQRVENMDLGGKPVEFSAMLRTAEVGKQGWVMVMTFKNHGDILDQVRAEPMTGDVAWKEVVLKKNAPPNTNAIEVGFMLLDGGTGWADGVRLRTLDTGESKRADKAVPMAGEKLKPAAPKPTLPVADKKAG